MSTIAFVVSASSRVLNLSLNFHFLILKESDYVVESGLICCHHIHLYYLQDSARLCSAVSLTLGMTILVYSQRHVGRNYVNQFLTLLTKSSHEQWSTHFPLFWKFQKWIENGGGLRLKNSGIPMYIGKKNSCRSELSILNFMWMT